eukprot:4756983-Amphidinium_carterae.8
MDSSADSLLYSDNPNDWICAQTTQIHNTGKLSEKTHTPGGELYWFWKTVSSLSDRPSAIGKGTITELIIVIIVSYYCHHSHHCLISSSPSASTTSASSSSTPSS